nr:hypothetical protein [uncultured Allomuricauda sp.]
MKKHKIKLLITFISIGVIVFLIVILLLNLFPAMDDNGRMNVIVNLITNILGTIIGAGLAFYFAIRQFTIQKSKEKTDSAVDLTLEFHEKFNSSEMFEARGKADKLILENHSESLAKLFDKFEEDKTRCVFLIVRFYEQLWYFIKHDKVDLKLVPDFFWEYLLLVVYSLFQTPTSSIKLASRKKYRTIKRMV